MLCVPSQAVRSLIARRIHLKAESEVLKSDPELLGQQDLHGVRAPTRVIP